MKIGIYKIGLKWLSDIGEVADVNGMYEEVWLLIDLFKTYGYDVHYVHPKGTETYDAIFVFNGVFTNDREDILLLLKGLTPELNYLLTEVTLIPDKQQCMNIDNIFTPCRRFLPQIPLENQYHSSLYRLKLYNHHYTPVGKSYEFVFGGGERKRLKDIVEYVIRPNFLYFGKSPTLGINNRIPIEEYSNILRKTKYSIVIMDPICNEMGYVTWRYFENISNGVITFVDSKCDPDGILMEEYHVLRVSNYIEMRQMMKEIDDNPELYNHLLDYQNSKFTKDDTSGIIVLNSLLRRRELNVQI